MRLSGLEPGRRYDLAVYLLQGPPKKVETPPTHRSVRVDLLHVPERKKIRDATVVASETIDVPATASFEKFEPVIAVTEQSETPRGNVLLFDSIPADDNGRIALVVQVAEQKKDGSWKWGDTTLAGVQIRRAE